MLSLIVATACLAATALAGTPPSYSPSTNGSLGVRYGHHNVREGEVLDYSSPSPLSIPHPTPKVANTLPVPAKAPILSSPTPLTAPSEYLAVLVDPNANLSAPNPAKLLWFQPNITFSTNASSNYHIYYATINSPATVPYLAPSVVGHPYIFFLYPQPPNFIIPPNFPYNNTFRSGFNVSRIAADFKAGGPLAANYFELRANATSGNATGTGAPSGASAGVAGPTAAPFMGAGALIESRMPLWGAFIGTVSAVLML